MRPQGPFSLVFALAPLLAAAQSQVAPQLQPQLTNPALQQVRFDPCADPAPPAPQPVATGPALQQQALEAALVKSNQGAGAGPVPDVFDWQPRGRAPANTLITITGQGFQTGGFNARIGGRMLTKVSASPTEIRLRIPASQRTEGDDLVVWHQGGRPRTLETGFRVFDPSVRITRVHPNSFGRGQIVTLCGSSLFYTFQASPNAGIPETRMLRIGNHYVEMHEPVFSQDGERATFRAGAVARQRLSTRNVDGTPFFEFVSQAPPATVTGRVALTSYYAQLQSSRQHNTDVQASFDSDWSATLPVQISKVHGRGVFSSVSPPFVLMETTGNNAPMSRQILIDGLGLDGAALRIGDRSLGTSNAQLLGHFAAADLAPGTPSGQVCASKAGRTACGSQVLRVARAPEFVTIPAMPLAMGVVHTISGLHLRPDPGIGGLSYDFRFSGAEPCAPLEIVQHSDSEIRFRMGSADQALSSACASNTTLFGANASSRNVMMFSATYGGMTHEYLRRPYWLRPPVQ